MLQQLLVYEAQEQLLEHIQLFSHIITRIDDVTMERRVITLPSSSTISVRQLEEL